MEDNKSRLPSALTISVAFLAIVVFFAVLRLLADIFIPLVIAYFIFFVFSPMNRYLQKKRVPLFAVMLLDILIILILAGGISTLLVDSFSRFGSELPAYEKKLNELVTSTAASFNMKDPSLKNFDARKALMTIDYKLLAGSLFSSTFSFLGSLFLVLFFFIFVATGHNKIMHAFQRRFVSEKKNSDESKETANSSKSVRETFQEITDQVQKYVTTKLMISLVTGTVEGVIIWAFGVDFALVWAVIIFLFNFIPNIGSIIGIMFPIVMALVQFGSLGYALILLAVLIVVDTILGNYVEPKVFGDRLGLNPLVVLLALLLWSYIWGIIGALLSVPLTSVLKIIISRSESKDMKLINDLMSS